MPSNPPCSPSHVPKTREKNRGIKCGKVGGGVWLAWRRWRHGTGREGIMVGHGGLMRNTQGNNMATT